MSLAVDEAFNDVLRPFDTINPTRTNISFEAAEPCRPRHLCLSKPFMRTKAGDDLYLKWSYSWFDFVKLALQSAAFKVYLIVLLLGMVAWKQIYLQLRTLAHTDHLTRLPRRDVLCQSLLHEHDYLMILDIDNFKSINDTWGHLNGDIVLRNVAREGLQVLQPLEISLYRYGGEEFAVVFPAEHIDNARTLLETWRVNVERRSWREDGLTVTFSAGLGEWNMEPLDKLVVSVDEALYKAKQQGKNRILRA